MRAAQADPGLSTRLGEKADEVRAGVKAAENQIEAHTSTTATEADHAWMRVVP